MTYTFKHTPWVVPFLASYEGEGEGDAGAGEGDAGAGVGAGAGAGAGAGDEKKFTQEDLNRIAAQNKRTLQDQLKATEAKYSTLETSYQELLQNQNLTNDEREGLQTQLSDLQKQFRTKEQQLAFEKKQAEDAANATIDSLREASTIWEQRYTDTTIRTELQSAAVKYNAYNPDQIIVQLRGNTKLVEQVDGAGKPTGQLKPMVEMTVTNDEGAPEVLQMTPDEAVAHMQKTPELWGNLFANNIREGIGSSSATGAMSGDGKVDHTKMTDEQYFAQREKDRTALGLKAQKDPWS